MDTETLKLLISTQEQAYRSALELLMKQANDRIGTIEANMTELRKSLEYTQGEVDDLKKEVKKLEKEKMEDKATIQSLSKECVDARKKMVDMEETCNYLEDYNRRNNIYITGMVEKTGGETWEQTADSVNNLIRHKLQLGNLDLERAHRVGQHGGGTLPRPVVARFSRFADRELVMRNAKKLSGTNVYFNDDLSLASQEKRKQQLPLLKKARQEGKIAYFRHTKLIIHEKSNMQGQSGGGGGLVEGTAAGVGTLDDGVVGPGAVVVDGGVNRPGPDHSSAAAALVSPSISQQNQHKPSQQPQGGRSLRDRSKK